MPEGRESGGLPIANDDGLGSALRVRFGRRQLKTPCRVSRESEAVFRSSEQLLFASGRHSLGFLFSSLLHCNSFAKASASTHSFEAAHCHGIMLNFTPLLGVQSTSPASQSLLEFEGGVKVLVDVGWDEEFDAAQLKSLER